MLNQRPGVLDPPHVTPEDASVLGCAYDILLRLVAGDEGLQERLFRP